MGYFYRVHGALICSDHPITGLPLAPWAVADLQLCVYAMADSGSAKTRGSALQSVGYDRVVHPGEDWASYSIQSPTHALHASFSPRGERLELGWWDRDHPGLEGLDRILTTFLLGNLIAFALRLQGKLVLHGNAAGTGQRAIAWVGAKGAGKSTLSAAFLDAGHALVTDDQLVLRPSGSLWCAAHGVPRIRLWPGSVQTLSAQTRSDFLQPFGDAIKGYLEISPPVSETPQISLRLAALYVLEPRCASLTTAVIRHLPAGERLQSLMQHRLARQGLPISSAQHAAEFAMFSKLASQLPIYGLQLPDRLTALPEVVRQLVDRHAKPAAAEVYG